MAAEHTCATCGGPAEVNEDFLHCPDCNTPTGRRFKDLWVSLRTRSRLAEAAGDTTLVALRYLVRERFGGWDAEALDRLAGWLVAKHRLTVDQVYVASFETLRGLLEQRAAENDDAPPKTEHQGGQGGIAPAGVDVSAIRDALSELQMAILSVEPVADGDGFDEADRFAWQSIIDSRDRLKAAIDSTEHLAAAIRPADLRRLAELIEYVGAMYHLDTDSPEIGPAPDELCRRLQNMFSIFPVPARQTRQPAAAARAATSSDLTPEVAGGTNTEPADDGEDRPKETPVEANEVLFGWSEILTAVKRPEERKERERIKRLNDDSDGPIHFPQGQGTQPEAAKADLIHWWNKRENAYRDSVDESARKDAELAANMQAEHNYGRAGTVLPEISGSKRSRKVTKDHD